MKSFPQFKSKVVSQPLNGINVFLNLYSYLMLRKSDAICKVDWIMIDGILLVLILRLFGIKVNRASFDMTSIAPVVFEDCIKQEKEIFLIGSTEQNITGFIQILRTNFPLLRIGGHRNGFFRNEEERNLAIRAIIDKNPDVVVVGMGTPLQEQFLLDLEKKEWKGTGFTCGGFIHQTTSKMDYYPKFFDKYNLRWLFRIYDEPKLITRYCTYYPISICLFIFDIIRSRLRRNGD